MIKWFARGGGIARSGPYDTQVEAAASLRLITETNADYRRACEQGARRKQYRDEFPSDAFVWPEET